MEDFPNMPELNFQGNRLLRNNYAELEFIAAKSINQNQKTTKKVEGSWTKQQKEQQSLCILEWIFFNRKWENKSIVHFQMEKNKKSECAQSIFEVSWSPP